ncbi:MAG: response regulator [Candidatus Cyclobacteriaceae bacterium M3_2C_046]
MKKLFIFEDDELTIDVLKSIFKEYEVKANTHCDQVLEDIKTFQPDCILMDLRIPQNGGDEATRKLKADPDLKHIPVILISADLKLKAKAESCGANDFISKPFEIQDLKELVNRLI